MHKEYHLPTSFRAEYGSARDGGVNVGVMCEYDALPEIGHACGHNLIAQIGIGAGCGLKAALQQSGVKNAKVSRIFDDTIVFNDAIVLAKLLIGF